MRSCLAWRAGGIDGVFRHWRSRADFHACNKRKEDGTKIDSMNTARMFLILEVSLGGNVEVSPQSNLLYNILLLLYFTTLLFPSYPQSYPQKTAAYTGLSWIASDNKPLIFPISLLPPALIIRFAFSLTLPSTIQTEAKNKSYESNEVSAVFHDGTVYLVEGTWASCPLGTATQTSIRY